jgi:hypothetical protein
MHRPWDSTGEPTLVGRKRELGLMDSVLDEARAGRGRLVVVTGPPGSGRTRLAREAAHAATRRGMDVVWDAAQEPTPPAGIGARPSASPLLVVLEDLHTAKAGALTSLVAAAPELSAQPVVLLCTWVGRLSAGIAEHALHVELEYLDVPSVASLAMHAGIDLPPGLPERLHLATGGNPLLVVETLGALATTGRVTGEPWPLSKHAIAWMGRRLGALSPACRAIVEAASILGVECDAATLARVAGDIDDEALVRQRLDQSLLTEALDGSGRQRFTPPLARDLVEGSLSDTRRAELHGRAATTLGEAPAGIMHAALAASAAHDFRGAEFHLRHLAALVLDARRDARGTIGTADAPSLAREGEYWRVAFGDRAVRVRERAGILYLARLVASPGVGIPAMALSMRTAQGPRAARECESSEHDGIPNDPGLATERARVRVTRRIRDAIERIAQEHPELGAHLARTIRTGACCTYLADPATAPRWDVRWSL